MNTADIYTSPNINDAQWYDSVYFQDDWKIAHNLTINLGLRYDFYQPYKENSGSQANFIQTGGLRISTGTGPYDVPTKPATPAPHHPPPPTLPNNHPPLH